MDTKLLSQRVDEYFVTRELRLKMQKDVDAVDKKEKLLAEEIIAVLQEAEAKAGAGSLCILTLQKKDKPVVGDWLKLYDYIHATKSFDLLQKRVGEGAVQARWEDGIIVPGVEAFPVFSLSISKSK